MKPIFGISFTEIMAIGFVVFCLFKFFQGFWTIEPTKKDIDEL